jgi:fido (protein-threonine AMPylation protein)
VAGLTEPVPGATPLDEDDLAGLIPTWVTTRADLDAVENDGIQRAMLWVSNPRVRYTTEDLLIAAFADRLHKRIFGMVWQWAGQRRQRITNIGIEPYQITTKLRDAFDAAAYCVVIDYLTEDVDLLVQERSSRRSHRDSRRRSTRQLPDEAQTLRSGQAGEIAEPFADAGDHVGVSGIVSW